MFAGGCSLEAIEAICTNDNLAPDAVLDVLTQLVDRSLVIPEEVDGSMRYRLLETMRAYGQERLRESGEGEAIRDRHLAWFRDLAVRAEVDFMGPNEEALLALQQREESNFRAALEWSRVAAIAADPERLESGLLLAGSLWRFWDMQGRLGEGRAQLTELLALPGAERPTRGRAKALFAAGYGAFYQGGDLNAAAGLWEEGVRIARSLGPAHEVSLCLWSLTVVSVSRGELDAAESYLAEQEAVSGAIGFALGSSIPIFWRGQIALLRGDRANGVARIRESLEFIQGHGDRWYAGTVMIPLGQLALADGELEAARVWFCRAVEIMSAFRDIHWMSVALLGLAWIASEQGEAERAARIMGGVEALCDAVGMPMVDLFFQASHERAIELARGQLGEAAFAAFWAAGRTVPFADFVADALGTGQPSSSDDVSARETAPAGTTLSPREGEVAALIARGLTNQQIAETLVISPLTAITHVRNIMRKLGVTSRAQVAAWVATNHGVGPQSLD